RCCFLLLCLPLRHRFSVHAPTTFELSALSLHDALPILLVETFVASTAALEAPEERKELTSGGLSAVMPESRAIVELCRRMRTVAEIAALLRMPLGVVRVLLSDLAGHGQIRVYGTGTGHGTGRPDRALLERVLSGLRRL